MVRRVCVVVLLIGLYEFAEAARPDRPRLAVEFQGPVGKTRAIGFLPTGNRLYAGGEGKVIDLFDVQDEFVTINSPGRWEFARGARGGINDIALTADGVHALMAGFSARGARDVTILNLTTRQVVGVLPRQPVGGPDSNAHSFSSILSVAVSPDSRHAASASANGEIWLWDLSQGFAQAVGRKIRNADASFVSEFNAIGFPDSDTLLYSLPNAAPSTGFQAVIYRISSGSKQYSGDQFQREVCAVTSSSDGSRIAIADTSGQVVIRDSGIGSPSRPLGPQSFGVLRNAVLSPSGQLLALMGDQAGSADSVLSLIDLTQNSLLDSITFSGKEACVTAAFDRDEARLLAHDNSREYLLLWNLRDAQGQRIPEPLQKESLAIGSRAQQFRTGRFLRDRSSAADGYRIQLATADGVFQYSLTDGEAEVAEQVPTIGGNEFSGGWNPEFLTEGQVTSLVQLTSPAGAVHQIRVDVVKQGELTGAYCFLPGSDRLPAAIALGTRKADGIYVYGLRGIPPQIQGATGLLRYFRDHNGEIRDLSVSHDGRYLLSTSVDRTLKLWSLEGLIDAGRKSIFGADIVTDGREVRIQNVRPAGIFYGRNLRDGDRLVRAVSVRTPPQGVTDAAGIVDLLKTNSPFEEMYLWTDRLGAGFREGGDDDRVVLVPGWEPLMTLVVDKSDEWVLFTPEGYYNASPAEGHRLFGWQYNLGRDKTPRFEVAASLQKEFEKPDLMRSILQQGSVAEALGAAGLPVPNDFQVALREQIESLPQISIQAPADNSIVPTGQPVSVRARVEIPQGRQPQDFEFQADVGGRSLGPPQLNPDGQFVICSWQTVVPDPVNTLRVSVTERNGSLTRSLQTDRTVTVRSESPSLRPSRPKLYLIALGAETYKYQETLNFAVDDATSVFRALKDHPHLVTEFSALSQLRTEAGVRKEVLQKDVAAVLADVRDRKNPDDLILIYVTGHGVLGSEVSSGEEVFYYLPPHVNNRQEQELKRDGIAWEDFSGLVNEAPCHVIWCIDACHSGAASELAKKSLNRDSAGTGRRCVFLSTSGASELARENSLARVQKSDEGHGWFTMAFLETLIGNEVFPDAAEAATELMADGQLKTSEMGKYVRNRVRDATDNNQRPVFTPRTIEPSTATGPPITLLQRATSNR